MKFSLSGGEKCEHQLRFNKAQQQPAPFHVTDYDYRTEVQALANSELCGWYVSHLELSELGTLCVLMSWLYTKATCPLH